MTPGRLLGAAAAGAVLVVVAFLALLTVEERNAPEPDCPTVQVRPGEWLDAAPPDRVVLFDRYEACDRLRGLTEDRVLAAFGRPDRRDGDLWAWRFAPDRPGFDGPELAFGADGRVAATLACRS